MTSWPSWLRRETVNLKIVSSTLTEVASFFSYTQPLMSFSGALSGFFATYRNYLCYLSEDSVTKHPLVLIPRMSRCDSYCTFVHFMNQYNRQFSWNFQWKFQNWENCFIQIEHVLLKSKSILCQWLLSMANFQCWKAVSHALL